MQLLRRGFSTFAIGAFLVFLPWYLVQYRLLGPGVAKGSVWQDDMTFFSPWFGLGKYRETVATRVMSLSDRGSIWGLSFSPHGRYLATSSPVTSDIHIWNWRQNRIMRTLREPKMDTLEVTVPLLFSPHKHILATCGSGRHAVVSRVWDTRTGALLRTLHSGSFYANCNAIAFTPYGRSLLQVGDHIGVETPGVNLIVYSTRTWQRRWVLRTEPFDPNTIAVSPHGHWAALGGSLFALAPPVAGELPSFDSHPEILIVNLKRHTEVRSIVTFPNPPPTLFGGQLVPVASYSSHALAWSPQGHTIAVGAMGIPKNGNSAFRIYSAQTGAFLWGGPGPQGSNIYSIQYTPNGRYLIVSDVGDNTEIWDVADHQLIQKISGQAGSIAISSHGRYMALGGLKNNQITLWRLHYK